MFSAAIYIYTGRYSFQYLPIKLAALVDVWTTSDPGMLTSRCNTDLSHPVTGDSGVNVDIIIPVVAFYCVLIGL